MASASELKQRLLATIEQARADGTYEESQVDAVHALVHELAPLTSLPRPYDRQEFVTDPWGTHFAQFGAKHTAGKPLVHVNDFRFLTFGNLPKGPVKVLAIEQEIHHASLDYNNVHLVETVDGGFKALLTIYGRYRIDAQEPQRYHVDFYKVALHGDASASEAATRAAFGFDAAQPLEIEFKPPKLSSDVIYCDDDMRINVGSLGGLYVLQRLNHSGRSVRFAR